MSILEFPVTKDEIREHFKEGPGTISEVKLMNGFGFIEYEDAVDARDVVPGMSWLSCSHMVVETFANIVSTRIPCVYDPSAARTSITKDFADKMQRWDRPQRQSSDRTIRSWISSTRLSRS